MRIALVSLLLMLPACTGEWGDWMQAEKPNEDKQFFCKFNDTCEKKSTAKGFYGDEHSLKAGDNIYKEESGVYGSAKTEDMYGKATSGDLYGK